MAAGIITGPHTPGLVLVETPEDLQLIAALGLVLLLFHLGLEFSLEDLIEGGPRLLAAGGTYLLLNVGGGLAFGFLLGWGVREAFVIAGAVGIFAARIHRLGRRAAASAGLTLLGRGEFSLIIATFAAAAGRDPRIGPFVAAYVVALAVFSPLLASRSGLVAERLPRALLPAARRT